MCDASLHQVALDAQQQPSLAPHVVGRQPGRFSSSTSLVSAGKNSASRRTAPLSDDTMVGGLPTLMGMAWVFLSEGWRRVRNGSRAACPARSMFWNK